MSDSNRSRLILRDDRRGVTLVLAIFTLVVLGAAVGTSFLVVRAERSSSTQSTYAGEAQLAAESGLAELQALWDPAVQNVLPIWTPTAPVEWSSGTRTLQANKLFHSATVRRLNPQLFQAIATGWRAAGTQRLSQLQLTQFYRIVKPTIGVNAAMTVSEPVKFNGNAFEVSGINATPPQWGAGECDALDAGNSDDVVGVRSAAGTGVGSSDLDNVFGFPAKHVANDPSITSATFNDFLDFTFATLGSQPGVKLLPNATPYNGVAPVIDISTGGCDKTVLLNFGEPFRNPPTASTVVPCIGYFPVVRGTGSVTKFAAGSRGQGTLLIEGDLEMVGGFEWVGLIIVRNQIKITGTGNKIYGALLAEGADVDTDNGSVGGNVEVHYSACAIQKAVSGASVAQPLGQRGWAQLYQ
ncbi:MAG: hypothetical protein SFU57_13670 [Gemmatimonadales bacterium]|nr:hypothetical protein [Gemmatimonadales bacterium]